jgi:hypothetical protein
LYPGKNLIGYFYVYSPSPDFWLKSCDALKQACDENSSAMVGARNKEHRATSWDELQRRGRSISSSIGYFVFSYVPEPASEDREGMSRRCRFEDLPENLDCFPRRALDGSMMMFDYCRHDRRDSKSPAHPGSTFQPL